MNTDSRFDFNQFVVRRILIVIILLPLFGACKTLDLWTPEEGTSRTIISPLNAALTQLAATLEAERSTVQLTPAIHATAQTKTVIDPVNASLLIPVDVLEQEGISDFSWLPDSQGVAIFTQSEGIFYDSQPIVNAGDLGANNPAMHSLSPDRKLIAWVSQENAIHVWDPEEGGEADILESVGAPVTSLAVSPQGESIAYSTTEKEIRIWESRYDLVPQVWNLPSWLADLSYSPDGALLAGADLANFIVYVFDSQTGEVKRTYQWVESASPNLYTVIFSPDWSNLAWIARETVQLMNADSGELGPMLSHEDFVSAFAWTPNGRLIAAAAGATIDGDFVPAVMIWDATSGQVVNTLVQPAAVQSLEFSPDGTELAILDSIGRLRMWVLAQ